MSSMINSLVTDIMDQQEKDKETKITKNINYIIVNIDPNKICENKLNEIYDSFTQSDAYIHLKENILEHGLLENIVVTKNDSTYTTEYDSSKFEYRAISGHRRLRAIKAILKEHPEAAKRFITIPVKIETYHSLEEELLALNSYNLHSRTLSAEDKLKILSIVKQKLNEIIGDTEPTEKQKLIRSEIKKYDSVFNGMADATKRRYVSISANSNPEISSLIDDGFTIHQLAKISNFPGSDFTPFPALLSKEKYLEIKDYLDRLGDIQAEILKAVNYLKEHNMWNNEVNMKNWRNFIINEFVSPVHLCLTTIKSNCSAYNISEAKKDKNNAISKITHQVDNYNRILEKFMYGYTNELLVSDNTKTMTGKAKVETEIEKINDPEESIKLLKLLINKASKLKALDSQIALELLNLI